MKQKTRVGILFGGRSAEHEVSLQSAKNIFEAIDRSKYEPIPIGITKEGKWVRFSSAAFLQNENNPSTITLLPSDDFVTLTPWYADHPLTSIEKGSDDSLSLDVVFPVLHGPYGEDGTVQGLLKLSSIPFVGASVLGSAVGMDKDIMKRLLRDAGVPVSSYQAFSDSQRSDISFEDLIQKLGKPLFIKPGNLGSSVGVSKVTTKKEFEKAVDLAFLYDRKILIESYVKGREIECAVLGNEDPKASIAGEIIPSGSFYSYKAKYIDEQGATLEIPAHIPEEVLKAIQNVAVKTFKTLACEGMARVDCFVTEDNEIYVNEINTIPGFTKISMYPKLWEKSGIGYTQLIDTLIQLAFKRHEKEKQLRTTVE